MQPGELCLFDQRPASVGDIIAFRADWGTTGRIVHRVVEIKDGRFYTQGDNASSRDEGHRTTEDIDGVLVGVAWGGPIFRTLMRIKYHIRSA